MERQKSMMFLNTTCLPPTWRNISKEQTLNEYQNVVIVWYIYIYNIDYIVYLTYEYYHRSQSQYCMNSLQSQITILHELKIASLLSCCFYLCKLCIKRHLYFCYASLEVANTLLIQTSSMKMFTRLLRSCAVYFTVECFTPQAGKILPIQVVLRLTIYVLCSRKFQITSN